MLQTFEHPASRMTFDQMGEGPASVRVNDVIDTFARTTEGSWKFASRTISRQITVSGVI